MGEAIIDLDQLNVCSSLRLKRADNFDYSMFGPVRCWKKGEKCRSVNIVWMVKHNTYIYPQAMVSFYMTMWNFQVKNHV